MRSSHRSVQGFMEPPGGAVDAGSSSVSQVSQVGSGGGLLSRISGRQTRPIPPKLYRMGEIVDYSGLSRQTIHNYTTMGLLRESQWTRGGHRLYDESVFERLNQVLLFKQQRKSMQEIREHFSRVDELQ